MYKIILLLIFTSCSTSIFYKKQPKEQELKNESINNKGYSSEITSWADSYYTSTVLVIENPQIKETDKQIFEICQGNDLPFSSGYSRSELSEIKFKKEVITVYTEDGFKKSVYVTKGICREIALLKSQLKDNEKSFRKSIKSLKVHYIYNGESYATELVLNTQFKSVEFHIK